MVDLAIRYLADRPEAIPQVADWIYGQWGHRNPGNSPDSVAAKLAAELSRDELPIQVVAALDGAVIGTAALKLHELQAHFPALRYWLGSVYVVPAARGQGIAGALVQHVEQLARARSIPALHLQTERLDGGLYTRWGFTPLGHHQQGGLAALVMVKALLPGTELALPVQSAQENAPASGTE